MALRIEDYAVLGDTQTAALVGRDGSIDWLCLPRFDSGSCFASLLGEPGHGCWRLNPVGETSPPRRRYLPETLILETEFETKSGVVRLIDFMPPRDASPDIIRIVEGVRGEVRMRMELVIRFDYGSVIPWVRKVGAVLCATAGPDSLYLHTPVDTHGEGLTTVAEFVVSRGARIPFVLTWNPSHLPVMVPAEPERALAETRAWWIDWSGRCTYKSPYRDQVVRSLITLKALTYAPTGGIVAAPTTSLPEAVGGVRNWDYRYCWLRDATLTLLALIRSGYIEEARAWRDWLLRSVAGKPEDLQIMYGVAGERRLTELELPWLAGYEGSRPVRIGNGASGQLQLDVYGEVVDAFTTARRHGLEDSDAAWRLTLK